MVSRIWRILLWGCLAVQVLPPVRSYYFGEGMRWQYIVLFAFLLSYLLSPLCATFASRLNVMDRPSERKRHNRPTPLFGGVAVFIALNAALGMNAVFMPGMVELMLAGALIFFVGLLDDIRDLSPLLRFGTQTVAALFVIFVGGITLKVFNGETWVVWLNIPLTALWLVGITNAMNFFDGIDGQAAGLSIIMSLFLGILAFKTNQPALGWLAVSIAGACSGFLPHNFIFGKSARLFLGDAGSTYLGFMLSGLAVFGEWSATSHFVSLTAPVLIFGVLIFDTAYVTLSRVKNQRTLNVFKAMSTPGRDHLHHRLLFMGFARKEAAFATFTIAVCFGVSALIIMDGKIEDALLGLLQAGLILTVIVALMLKGRDVRGERGDQPEKPEVCPPWRGTIHPIDLELVSRKREKDPTKRPQ